MASSSLPPNVHVSTHPCVQVKLSQLRSTSLSDSRHVKQVIDQITAIVTTEATAHAFKVEQGQKAKTCMGLDYTTTVLAEESQSVSLVPILRSGLGMIDAVQALLPDPVPVHHLGLYREPATLSPVEYYNNLPYKTTIAGGQHKNTSASKLAFILDPVLATGGTCAAAIQILKDWGVEKIIVLVILGAKEGVLKAASEWPEGTEIWLAGLDESVDGKGMIVPGLGDVGDRLFMTIGKDRGEVEVATAERRPSRAIETVRDEKEVAGKEIKKRRDSKVAESCAMPDM